MERKTLLNHETPFETKPLLASVGNCVKFTYKGGRKVWGEILFIDKNTVILRLKSDYIGKNVEWFIGEKKSFNIKECKNFRLTNHY